MLIVNYLYIIYHNVIMKLYFIDFIILNTTRVLSKQSSLYVINRLDSVDEKKKTYTINYTNTIHYTIKKSE